MHACNHCIQDAAGTFRAFAQGYSHLQAKRPACRGVQVCVMQQALAAAGYNHAVESKGSTFHTHLFPNTKC